MKYIYILLLLFSIQLNGQAILLDERFQSGIPNDWSVDSDNTYREWQSKSYKDSHYAQMSAFGGKGKNGVAVSTVLYSPVLSTHNKSCRLRFEFADAFTNAMPLAVNLYSESNKKIKALNSSNWEDLFDNNGFYDNNYQTTPWIDLPNIDQAYKIGFLYDSKNGTIAGTIQLSNVKVWCK